jgi:hypothetical protein
MVIRRTPELDLDALSAAVERAADHLEWRLKMLIQLGEWEMDERRVCVVCLMPVAQCVGHGEGSK